MLKIATWNINSIRARISVILSWLRKENPDILLVQELKCENSQFPFFEFESLGYNIEIAGQKARNGVAIFSKYPLYNVNKSLPLFDLINEDNDARYIEAYIDYNKQSIKVASVYVPNGGPTVAELKNLTSVTDTETFRKKMMFYDRLNLLFQENIKHNEFAIFGGDYNVCPNLYMDVHSLKKDGSITCTKQEREKFQSFLNADMCDIWRELNKDLRDYSWYGYRPYYMWEKRLGYRIDSLLVTPKIKQLITKCDIYSIGVRDQEKASDHVPMMCYLK